MSGWPGATFPGLGGGAPVPSPSPPKTFRGKGYLDIFNTTPPGSASMNEYDATLVSANKSFPYQLLAVSGSICESSLPIN